MANDELDDDLGLPATAAPGVRDKLAQQAATSRPWLDRALLNLRVWFPFLRTPDMRVRQVKYRSSDARSGMSWKVGLPQQCYACGATEGLTRKKFSNEIRVFEAPSTILGGTLGAASLFLLCGVLFFWWSFLVLGLLTLVLGCAYQFVKSWTERVTITIWSCPEHLEELTPPEAVSHDEDLYVYLPHESLAEPARAELIASRKKEQKSRPSGASPDESPQPQAEPSPDHGAGPPPARPIAARTELPPLKLAGDEEEA
ncbi:MAG TPA: hypothetical protein VG826_34110 [Pirellulales bacterium]|nr:hypothetical protein [Pirellulales bacterium]